MFILAKVITVETRLQGKGVSDHELFPGNDTASAQFVGLNFKPTITVVKEMSLLGKNSRQQSYYGPAQETAISCCIAAIEETVFLF
jgi:hypothetical protein